MKGEPINISNIEKKVKEGFDTVSDKFRDVDYKKYTQKANQGSFSVFSIPGRFYSHLPKNYRKIYRNSYPFICRIRFNRPPV